MSANAKREEAFTWMRELEIEPEHVEHVAKLALSLFDQLSGLHGLAARERMILEAAGWLHDIGWTVARDGKGHHKESARLIRERHWQHWAAAEVEMVATVARYHRKAEPTEEHEEYSRLNAADRARVEALAALLRLADAMDRSHTQRIEAVEVRVNAADLVITLSSRRPLEAEHGALEKKGRLAERIWGRKLFFDRVRPRR
jgi:exopolyphosphatase/guanosine-5'-triphosphate,3'-diphosphate pyrophosphatase